MNRIGTNSGHGHVWPRPDSLIVPCGGVGTCPDCSRDAKIYAAPGESSSSPEVKSEQAPPQTTLSGIVKMRQEASQKAKEDVGTMPKGVIPDVYVGESSWPALRERIAILERDAEELRRQIDVRHERELALTREVEHARTQCDGYRQRLFDQQKRTDTAAEELRDLRKRHSAFLNRIKHMLGYTDWPVIPEVFLDGVGNLLSDKLQWQKNRILELEAELSIMPNGPSPPTNVTAHPPVIGRMTGKDVSTESLEQYVADRRAEGYVYSEDVDLILPPAVNQEDIVALQAIRERCQGDYSPVMKAIDVLADILQRRVLGK